MSTDPGGVFRFATSAATLGDLPDLQSVIARTCEAAGAPETVRADFRLAVEEVFTNIVRHGYRGGPAGPVRCDAEGRPGEMTVRFEDDAAPWDPDAVHPPALASGWSDREIGGLGWHLIRQLMDEVRHMRRAPRGNVLTLVKRWEA